jgi:RNA polymerase sigma-70 factor (ECF subfamily)
VKRSSEDTERSAIDSELVERYVSGDPLAFLEIVRRYQAMVFRVALRITGRREDAEDAAQDTFIQLATKLKDFEGRSALKTWTYRVAVNAALMVVRRNRKHEHDDLGAPGGEFDDDGDFVRFPPDWSTLPESEVLSREAREIIERGIDKLPERFKTVLVLADIENLTNDEIRQILDLSLPAVKSRLHRARLFLRKELAAYFGKRAT